MVSANTLTTLIESWHEESQSLVNWWLDHAVDERGGVFGQIGHDNTVVAGAEKCIILQARALWYFSELGVQPDVPPATKNRVTHAARHLFEFIKTAFYDSTHLGFYWSVSADGQLLDGRKHTYAQSFAVYALSAYYTLTGESSALTMALQGFECLERHAFDADHEGYCESFHRDWSAQKDVRLSEKEDNHPKTMNTHLHLLEGYTGLANALMDARSRAVEPADEERKIFTTVLERLGYVLALYCERIVDIKTGHIKMFLTNDWVDCSADFSYGHDIESSWLIRKAQKTLLNGGGVLSPCVSLPASTLEAVEAAANIMVSTCLAQGVDAQGRMLDEVHKQSGHSSRTAWWVQMEALVGFAYQWQAQKDDRILVVIESIWRNTLASYKDHRYGEWHWFAKEDLPFEQSEYKTGAWKAPYHTGRTFIELLKIFNGAL